MIAGLMLSCCCAVVSAVLTADMSEQAGQSPDSYCDALRAPFAASCSLFLGWRFQGFGVSDECHFGEFCSLGFE